MARFVPLAFAAFAASTTSAQTIIGPLEYLSGADASFASLDGFVLEDFEDGFNTPGVTASVGSAITPGSSTDSVDADDGAIDGSGNFGRSFFSGSGTTGITFTFDETILGELPKAAGLVWTDGASTITFQAFDAGGMLLGEAQGNHADNNFGGGTAEDRFYGVTFEGGIGSIRISNLSGGIEVDHLQFAFPIPAPASLALLSVAAFATPRRR